MSAAMRTGAQIICEALIRENVEVLFGIPGGNIMPLYHALWEYHAHLRHVLCRHEQGAGHAAEGYARASGRVGVCIATSGPGATNLVTPIADAWMDGTPLVAITGQVSRAVLGSDAFQEVDITGITVPVTKHSYLVSDAHELPRVVAEAFHIARTGRPGPVLIDVTKDAQLATVTPDWSQPLDLPGYRPAQVPHADSLQAAADALSRAARPLILAGHGVIQSGASDALLAFAEHTGIPVITTLQGLGAFPQEHPLSLGMPGMHGWVHVNRAIQACDVLCNIGSRFDDRVTGKASTFAPRATIVHVDIDAAEMAKTVRADIPVLGDARRALEALRVLVPTLDTASWRATVHALRAEYQPRQAYVRRERIAPLMPYDVFDVMHETFARRADWRVVTDVGQHQMWAAQLLEWRRPGTHITSGGAGTMGFAIPAALGAAIAAPNDTIWAVVGDGGFQMTNQELATIQQEGLRNVKVAVINNGHLGMVRQWQELFHSRRYSGTPLSGPDFAALAHAYGMMGVRVERVEEAAPAIERAWRHDGPSLVDFRVDQGANVFPIVPAGSSIGEMITQ
ncbi:MAG: biosynthetic-type acetolactate synthase large subunit [Gemmatimonadetes bacterium]|nr:biosynthetic-type acetolactate synthase large subunit [Gemmatimonadota bacterium]